MDKEAMQKRVAELEYEMDRLRFLVHEAIAFNEDVKKLVKGNVLAGYGALTVGVNLDFARKNIEAVMKNRINDDKGDFVVQDEVN